MGRRELEVEEEGEVAEAVQAGGVEDLGVEERILIWQMTEVARTLRLEGPTPPSTE